MYVEDLKNRNMNGPLGFLIIVAIVFGILGLMIVARFLNYVFNVNFFQFFLLAIVFLLAFVIVKKLLTEYVYILANDRVILGRRLGKREKELLQFPYRDIKEFGYYYNIKNKYVNKKKTKLTFKRANEQTFCLALVDRLVLLNVTDKFIEELKKRT